MGGACAPGRVGSDVVGRGGCADSTDAAFDADPADVGATVVSPPALQVEGLPVEGLPVEGLPVEGLPVEALPAKAAPVEGVIARRASIASSRGAGVGRLRGNDPWRGGQPVRYVQDDKAERTDCDAHQHPEPDEPARA